VTGTFGGSAMFVKMSHTLTQPAVFLAGSGLTLEVPTPDDTTVNRNVVSSAFRILSNGQPRLYLLARSTSTTAYWVWSAF
jgi:hypothetical protein